MQVQINTDRNIEGREALPTRVSSAVDLAVDGAAGKLTRLIESTVGKLQDQRVRRTDPPPPGSKLPGER